MADYRVYRYDGGSRIELAEWIEASDDAVAIERTRQLARQAVKCELWQGSRLVVALNLRDLAE